MRSRLLNSFAFVLGFWWLAAALYWSMCDPSLNLASLHRVASLFPWIAAHYPQHVNVLSAWAIQKQVLSFWSLPVVATTLFVAGLGGTTVWLFAFGRNRERNSRIAHEIEYRGITLSLGPLPTPQLPAQHAVTLRATDTSLSALSDEQRSVLGETLGLIAANGDAFAGEGQEAGSLMAQTLKSTHKALARKEHPGLAALAAAASQLGKITAWRKDEDGAWHRLRAEERESARLLAGLSSWWALPTAERLAVLLAVKYRSHPEDIPQLHDDQAAAPLARKLIEQAPKQEAPREAAAQPAPAQVYEQRDPDTELMKLFEREVATFPFQTMGLPKNIPAVGWKKGRRAYLLESQVTEKLFPKLPAEMQASFAPPQEKVRIVPLTAALLRLFHAKGWLVTENVTENGTDKVPPSEALWCIVAGKLDFSRVIVLDLPDDILERLPSKDSLYPVTIKRPLFVSPLGNPISKNDLLAGLLRPKGSSSSPQTSKSAGASPATPAATS